MAGYYKVYSTNTGMFQRTTEHCYNQPNCNSLLSCDFVNFKEVSYKLYTAVYNSVFLFHLIYSSN